MSVTDQKAVIPITYMKSKRTVESYQTTLQSVHRFSEPAPDEPPSAWQNEQCDARHLVDSTLTRGVTSRTVDPGTIIRVLIGSSSAANSKMRITFCNWLAAICLNVDTAPHLAHPDLK